MAGFRARARVFRTRPQPRSTPLVKSSCTPIVAVAAALVAMLPLPVLAAEADPAAAETLWLLGPFGFWWLLGVAGAALALW
ncbi:MAG TPA: hypothetical protein DC048_07920, partial [Planctomycetaceae bacterium]|nr:hypothetical protein [Planctomycetaceae bacterium]